MSVPSPPALPAGHSVTASDTTSLINTTKYGIYEPAVKITRSTAQTIATSTATAVSFDSTAFTSVNGSGMVNIGTNPTRITIVDPGIYIITGGSGWAINATGVRSYSIKKNGTTVLSQTIVTAATGGGNASFMVLSAWDLFAANDYLELILAQDSGGNLNTSTGPAPFLVACRASG